MVKTIFFVIVAIVIFDFILEQILTFLNRSKSRGKIPEELEGIYEPENYKKQLNYKRENELLSVVTASLSFVIIMLMLFFRGFAFVDQIARSGQTILS